MTQHGPPSRQVPGPAFAALLLAALIVLAAAFHAQPILGALSSFAAVPVCYLLLSGRRAWAANGAVLALGATAAWLLLDRPIATGVAAALVAVSVVSAVSVKVIEIGRRRREVRAATDSLTGVANRLHLRDTLEEAVGRSRRTGAQMTLILLDLDHLASINDTLGRESGDAVLRGVGALLRQHARPEDQVFRTGDDEFLVLLDSLDVLNGRDLAEQVRAAIAGQPLAADLRVTASVGVAGLQPGEGSTAWMQRAGQRMRDAKAGGRDRVVA